MTQIFVYGEVDLPPIPDELLSNLNFCSEEKYIADIGYGKVFVKDNKIKNNTSYSRYMLWDDALVTWFKKTVPPWPSHEHLILQKNAPNGNDKDCIFPVHQDLRRMFALNYILDAGGDCVITSWFRDVNQPVLRGLNKPIGMQSDSGPVDYADTKLLASAHFEVRKWYLIRANVLHDVDHIDSERSSITVPYFDEDILNEFKQKNLFKSIKEIDVID